LLHQVLGQMLALVLVQNLLLLPQTAARFDESPFLPPQLLMVEHYQPDDQAALISEDDLDHACVG
jgi:hypothetical protein